MVNLSYRRFVRSMGKFAFWTGPMVVLVQRDTIYHAGLIRFESTPLLRAISQV